MNQSLELRSFYEDYYNDEVARKRVIAAKQTVDHISALCGGASLGNLLDVGAGDGAVLAEIEKRGMASELHAVEISNSGIERIRQRKLNTLQSVQEFDGYKLPFADNSFDTALAVHVLEHVEHERLFLRELSRVARRCYIEVPLEHTFRVQRAIQTSAPYGHLNFYTPETFKNLLSTVELSLLSIAVFPNSLDYEVFLSGPFVGKAKYLIRSFALKLFPRLSPELFVYICGALCERK
ncbi:class I SAM-dependent methyltransferase [Bradyrhizobium paxllaeri]|uniref:class I SAM-dependent methyltransferase n=1 Tax=Bradyrhizobium paxllaeri TaxID=190148 RepID=UPI000810B861|nr:class I SAM-dependent methyltransferase [Bradyrhizobium paxllaeri]